MRQYSYAWEKLEAARHALSVGPGDIRSRLLSAYMAFHTLQEDDFPISLRKDWNWIVKQLTKKEPYILANGRIYSGSVEETCRAMKNKTGVKIAERLLKLLDEVDTLKW
jgi:hypothetical protein